MTATSKAPQAPDPVCAAERKTIRVFVLDDHEAVRHEILELLARENGIEVVGDCGSAVEATRRILDLRPDVAVLDVRLPDGSGISVCRSIRAVDPTIKVLILTAYDDEVARAAAVMAGASAYLLKEIRGGAVVAGIRTLAGGLSNRQIGALTGADAPRPVREQRPGVPWVPKTDRLGVTRHDVRSSGRPDGHA